MRAEHLHELARALLAAAVSPSPIWSSRRRPRGSRRADVPRRPLRRSHGFLLWNNDWYSGHYLLCYSVIYPPLGALLGPRLLGALAVVAAAALFALLARRRYGDRAGLAVAWFGAATATNLVTGRITFVLGLAVGARAIWALSERRTAVGGGARRARRRWRARWRACSSRSPRPSRAWVSPAERRPAAVVALGGARGDGGRLARVPDSAAGSRSRSRRYRRCRCSGRGAGLARPREERWLRQRGRRSTGSLCTVFVIVASRWAPTSPASARCSPGRSSRWCSSAARPLALALLALPLLYWQWVAPVRDFVDQTRRPVGRALLLRAAARRARPATARRPGPDRGPADARTAGRRPTSLRATRSPAAGCASSSPTTSICSRAGSLTPALLPALARRARRLLRGGPGRRARLHLARTRRR